MKVLIIPDKFKGTLTARQAGEAIAAGWRAVRPEDELEILPMSDGGDGFGEIIGGMMGAEPIVVPTVDAAHRPHPATFWLHAPSATAIIEAAQVNGLALLPPGQFHPFDLDTFGLAKVYQVAAALKAKKIIVGIGGSSTNDAGFGFARGLGWRFHDGAGHEIERWTDLNRLAKASTPTQMIVIETIVAVDVQNPLVGPNGASRVYGPQKGLREQDFPKAEACLDRLREVINELNNSAGRTMAKNMGLGRWESQDFGSRPGAGAAGGLGFGFHAFVGARFVPGFDIFAEAARLEERLENADVVISGEGSMDAQSLMGKGVGALFQRCQEQGIRFIGLAGSVGEDVAQNIGEKRNLALFGIVPQFASLQDAKAEPAKWLRHLAQQAAKNVGSV